MSKDNGSEKRKRIWLFVLIGFITILVSIAIIIAIKKYIAEDEKNVVKEIIYDSWFLSLDEDLERDHFALLTTSTKARLKKEEDYFIQSKEVKVDTDFPAYQNDGATLFFLNNHYRFLLNDFSVEEGIANTYISCGLAFDQNNEKVQDKQILFLALSNGYYMNSSPIQIEESITETVSANAILKLDENNLTIYEYVNGELYRRSIRIEEEAICIMGSTTFSYYELYQFIDATKENQFEKVPKPRELEVEGFYYFLGKRYELSQKSIIYSIKNGYLIENNGYRYKLGSFPIYNYGEKKLILPTEYALMQPSQYWVNGLPAITEVKMGEYAVYFSFENISKAYNDIFLYDGEENYIIFSESTLIINDEELTITPFSCITIEEGNKVSVYQYDTDEYISYDTKGNRALLNIFDSITIDLIDKKMIRRDQTKELLITDPSILPIIRQE